MIGRSKNRRERPECKAHGAVASGILPHATLAHPCAAQEPQCTCGYMRIPSTAQRTTPWMEEVELRLEQQPSTRVAQQVSRGSLDFSTPFTDRLTNSTSVCTFCVCCTPIARGSCRGGEC